MNRDQPAQPGVHASSTGQTMTGADWLDVHFDACRPEYEAMLRSVGIQTGWHVLDAGCGSGSYLPLMAALVGPAGRIAALDLAPDNVASVEHRTSGWERATAVEARVGSILSLPYEDAAFDAVWCAATTQYLTDRELTVALGEFRRVVRPGGLVTIKEFDATMPRFTPARPLLFAHTFEVLARGGELQVQAAGCLRAQSLPIWLRRAGLTSVWMRRSLIERSAPLGLSERQLWGDYFTLWAPMMLRHELPDEDRAVWERLANPAEREHLLDDPDFSSCEGHVVAVGTV